MPKVAYQGQLFRSERAKWDARRESWCIGCSFLTDGMQCSRPGDFPPCCSEHGGKSVVWVHCGEVGQLVGEPKIVLYPLRDAVCFTCGRMLRGGASALALKKGAGRRGDLRLTMPVKGVEGVENKDMCPMCVVIAMRRQRNGRRLYLERMMFEYARLSEDERKLAARCLVDAETGSRGWFGVLEREASKEAENN